MTFVSRFSIALFLLLTSLQASIAQDAVYKVSFDADPLIKVMNGREIPGSATVRVSVFGRDGEVLGGKLCNGIISTVTIDEEDDIGKVIGVEVTLNGIGWTKSVMIRTVKVRKTVDDESKSYTFPCGCPLTQGNQTVYIDAGGAAEFVADAEAIQAEEMEDFEMDGEFMSGDVKAAGFTISKRNTGNPKPKPVGPARETKGKNRICTTQKYNASASFDKNFLTNPTQETIYPGALIYAEDLADGSYNNITKARTPIMISTTSPIIGGVPAMSVDNPALSSVATVMNDIMINQSRGDLDIQANYEIFEVSSKEELSIAIGGHFESTNATINASFSYDTNSEQTLKVVKFNQIYYSMRVDPPSAPEDVFMNPKDAMKVMNSDKTPLYVSSVTYGRIAYFFMRTSLTTSDLQAQADAEFRGAATAGVDADLKTSMEKGETKISALIIGGDGAEGIPLGYDDFLGMLETGGTLSPSSLGVPVSYTLRFLSDNSVARTNLATDYVKRTCKEVTNPIQKARITVHSVTASNPASKEHGNKKMNGKFEAHLCNNDLNWSKMVMQENLWSENQPGQMISDVAVQIDESSDAFDIDTRKFNDLSLKVFFTATEHDYNVFQGNDTNTKDKEFYLNKIMSMDPPPSNLKVDDPTAETLTAQEITLTVDDQVYVLKFSISLL